MSVFNLLLAASATASLFSPNSTHFRPVRAKMPRVIFEPNAGQTDAEVQYVARGQAFTLYLTAREAVFVLRNPQSPSRSVIRMKLAGSPSAAHWRSLDPVPGISNYFLGNDPSGWRTHIPHYARVEAREIYPGVDLVFYSNGRNLEYDFALAPGADPNRIQLHFEGAERLRVAATGDLLLDVDGAVLRQRRPNVYQTSDGTANALPGAYRIAKNGDVHFAVSNHNSRLPLVIDPVLTYQTYLGGNIADTGTDIAVDSDGNAFVTGWTDSLHYPTSGSPFRDFNSGLRDTFVTKMNAAGTLMLYSTYVGGNGSDEGNAIVIDSTGAAYVTGSTTSSNFPTGNAPQPANNGGTDAFVFKLSSTGSSLLFSSYLGGSGDDTGYAIGLDALRNVYVAGGTRSPDFPIKAAFQSVPGGGEDGFLTKITASGADILSSTYIGGAGDDRATSLVLDSIGTVNLAGWGSCATFPTVTSNIGPRGAQDGFLARINPDGLGSLTCIGGRGIDGINRIAIDTGGGLYLTGYTLSSDFPVQNAVQNLYGGTDGAGTLGDAFITKLNPTATAIVFSTYLGGSRDDTGTSIAVDTNNNVYVAGNTASFNFPSVNSPPPTKVFSNGGFVVRLNDAGAQLLFTTYFDGVDQQDRFAVALDPHNNVYFTGGATNAFSSPRAKTPPLFPYFGSGRDLFLAKFSDANLAVSQSQFLLPYSQPGQNNLLNIRVTNRGREGADNVRITTSFPPGVTLLSCSSPGATCLLSGSSLRIDFAQLAAGDSIQAAVTVNLSSTLADPTVIAATVITRSDTNDPRQSDNTAIPSLVVSQSGANCTYSAALTSGTLDSIGGLGTFSVTTAPGCPWAASSGVPWALVNGSGSGSGPANGTFTYTPYSGASPRTGFLMVGGQAVPLMQRTAFPVPAFTDVAPGYPYFESINLLKQYGITAGCTSTQYCPESTTTRSQMAVFIIRALFGGDDFSYNATPFFTDVPSSHPHFRWVQKMKELGITDGCGPTLYCPDNPVTRGQMAVFLMRAKLGLANATTPTLATPFFDDVPPSHPYIAFIAKMRESGITVGCAPTRYCPDDPTTRGQMAVFLIRTFFAP